MNTPSKDVIERVKVREVSGVFRSPSALDVAVSALLRGGFDRADIDIMADVDEVAATLRTGSVSAAELADLRATPRVPLINPEDVVLVVCCVAGIIAFVCAAVAALSIIAAHGSTAAAVVAALAVGAVTGPIAAYFAYTYFGRDPKADMRALVAAGGIVLWVRVRSADDERKALAILSQNGALAPHAHEIELEKRLDDLPLSSMRPDPWLGTNSLGDTKH
jgi:hypothetical protein